ncbi:helix-turn-helix domain-containing protein [Paenibacillus aceris]|uniref:YesN/AraC family two-component response regulator n=1 Tax=Paenibacillus aceris TaxID=869555 RepID=A0ABS4I075_9BACL|nr:helix-turn-helix domain-containing protein [Paenibacillus aceris]MBP1964285.1 YesN/AraC family two-component response regulator [Paenibacillus aceris]NHW36606.1 helix-turn-helix transcriptional regulator [Paenibacillus aceris]
MMLSNLKLRATANSLFIRLFASFLIVVVILVSFNYFSLTFSKNKVRDEIINYNTMNLKSTTDNYEKEFELIKNQLLNLYFNENEQLMYFNGDTINYEIAAKTMQDIRQITNNPLLYLDNLILYYRKPNLVLDKNSITSDSTFFNKFYSSKDYPLAFWQAQFQNSTHFRVYAPSNFYDIPFTNDYNSLGQAFPVIVKNNWYQDFYMAAFLDIRKMFQAFHLSINDNFFILDADGKQLFTSSTDEKLGAPPTYDKEKMYIKKDNYYYFYREGAISGLIYVNVVPDAFIASQVKLNVSLVSLLIVTLGIGIVASLLFSFGFHQPIRRMIASFKHYNPLSPVQSRINEFNQLGSQINRIHADLSRKNLQLQSFAYMSSVKKIRNNLEMDFIDRPYVIVIFELTYKKRGQEHLAIEQNGTYYMKEFIDFQFKSQYSESLTFQIEASRIMSFAFIEETDYPALKDLLVQMQGIFDLDKEELYVTMAISSFYSSAAQMTEAYDEALQLSKQRRLNDKTQIIDKHLAQDLVTMFLPQQQEQEFAVNLQAGNATETRQIVNRFLAQLHKRTVSSLQFYHFANEIIHKTLKTLTTLQVDFRHLGDLASLQEQIFGCHTYEQLVSYLNEFLISSIELVNRKKEERDPITTFAIEYLEKNYSGDITLELIADKLNISSGYLSTYFKDKTGVNFLDFLNDLRIRKAREMLLEPGSRIQDVARKAGYQNMNSFNRMFKKFSGITPSEFRKQTVS